MGATHTKKDAYPANSKVLEIAKAANNHAREQIIHGSTQLEDNELSDIYFNALRKAVHTDIRPLIEELIDPIEEHPILRNYESNIALTSKYSLGNCHELALQALDYVLNNASDNLSAEVYSIQEEITFF